MDASTLHLTADVLSHNDSPSSFKNLLSIEIARGIVVLGKGTAFNQVLGTICDSDIAV